MKIGKNQLWKVPAFCVAAGLITDLLLFGAEFLVWLVSYPDDRHVDYLLFYGLCFLAVMLLGGLYFLRDMTRKELFASVSIVVLYGAALYAIEWVDELRWAAAGEPWLSWWGRFPDWSWTLFSPLRWMDAVTYMDPPLKAWQSRVLTLLLPYLFVLFGKSGDKRS